MAEEGTPITNADAGSFGSNYVICQRTGFRVKVKKGLRQEWNGTLVRADSYEERHQQDFVRSKAEGLPGAQRPEQADRFLADNEVRAADL